MPRNYCTAAVGSAHLRQSGGQCREITAIVLVVSQYAIHCAAQLESNGNWRVESATNDLATPWPQQSVGIPVVRCAASTLIASRDDDHHQQHLWARTVSNRLALVCCKSGPTVHCVAPDESVVKLPVQRAIRVQCVHAVSACFCPCWHTLGTTGVWSPCGMPPADVQWERRK
jgi:hypothetical protein